MAELRWDLLLSGLGGMSLAGVAFSLRNGSAALPWRWLLAFGLANALRAWLGIPHAFPVAVAPLVVLRSLTSAAAAVALLEFARRTLAQLYPRTPGPWLLPVALIPVLAGHMLGWSPMAAAPEACLGAVAGVAAAVVMGVVAREEVPRCRRSLRMAGAVLAAYAIFAGLATALWRVDPAMLPGAQSLGAHHAVFIPHLFDELLGLGAAAALLVYFIGSETRAGGLFRIRATMAIGSGAGLILMLGLGWAIAGRLDGTAAGAKVSVAGIIGVAISAGQFGLLIGLLSVWRPAVDWERRIRSQSGNLLSSITDSTESGLLAVDENGRVAYSNARFAELWKLPHAFMHQGDARILLGFLRDRLEESEEYLSLIERALSSRDKTLEILRLRDGRVFQCHVSLVPGERGRNGHMFAFREITERAQAETERQAHEVRLEHLTEGLLALTRQLSASHAEPGGAREVVEIAAGTLQVDWAGIWVRVGDGPPLRCEEFRSPEDEPPEQRARRIGACGAYLGVVDAARASAIHDTNADPRSRELYASGSDLRDIGALLTVPITSGDRGVGTLLLAQGGGARHWSADEIQFAGAAAALAALQFDFAAQAELGKKLEEAQRLQELILETSAAAIYATDREGLITSVNRGLCAVTGYFADELIGRPATILGSGRCGESCPLVRREIADPIVRHPCQLVDREGHRLEVIRNVSAISDPSGAPIGALVSLIDVTEAVQAHETADAARMETEAVRNEARSAGERVAALERELSHAQQAAQAKHEEAQQATARLTLVHESAQAELAQAREAAESERAQLREAARAEQANAEQRHAAELEQARESARVAELARVQELEEEIKRVRQQAQSSSQGVGAQIEAVRREAQEALRAVQAEAERRAHSVEQEAERRIEQAQAAATAAGAESAAARAEAERAQERVRALESALQKVQLEREESRRKPPTTTKKAVREEAIRPQPTRELKPRLSPGSASKAQTPSTPQPVAPPAAPMDITALLASVSGDREMAARRVRAFLKGSPWMMARLRQALARRDPRVVAAASRALREALADLTARTAVEQAEQLERWGMEGDLRSANKLFPALEVEIERLRAALAGFSKAA